MFTDTPFLSITADHRRRELLAEADRFRLGRLARSARREARAAQRSAELRRAVVPAARSVERSNVDAERRYPVPR